MRKKKFVKVCVSCGSTRLEMLLLGYGLVPFGNEVSGLYTCRECKWSGNPVEVANVKEFKKMLEKKKD